MEGTDYRIELVAAGESTEHLLRNPSQRQLSEYRDNFYQQIRYGSRRKTVIRLKAAQAFYDSVLIKAEGYVSAIPVNHKAAVAISLAALIGAKTGEARSVNFTKPNGPSGQDSVT